MSSLESKLNQVEKKHTSDNVLICNGFLIYNETVIFEKDILCKGSVVYKDKEIEELKKRLEIMEQQIKELKKHLN